MVVHELDLYCFSQLINGKEIDDNQKLGTFRSSVLFPSVDVRDSKSVLSKHD